MKNHPLLRRAGRLTSEFLSYNKTEQRGVIVLILILFALLAANAWVPSSTRPLPQDTAAFSAGVRQFLEEWKRAADSDSVARLAAYRDRYDSLNGRHTGRSHPSRPLLVIELNSADTLDLQQLRGIGPGFARRIVGYRRRLGGYTDPGQLLEIEGLDTARFRVIAANLTVNTDSVKPLDLNRVTMKELLRHPYFPFPVAKNIILYRQKNKRFRSVDELNTIGGVSDSLFRRMVPYVRVLP